MATRYGVAAERELADAAAFYEQERAGLGDEFLRDVRRLSGLLIDHPHLGQPVSANRRALLLSRFPYRLIYDIETNGIRILAVAHQRRFPGYWAGCVEEERAHYRVLPKAA